MIWLIALIIMTFAVDWAVKNQLSICPELSTDRLKERQIGGRWPNLVLELTTDRLKERQIGGRWPNLVLELTTDRMKEKIRGSE